MRNLGQLVAGLAVLSIPLSVLFFDNASAATSINGVGASPAIKNIVLTPTQNSDTYSVSLSNNTTRTLDSTVKVSDFTTAGVSNSLVFLNAQQENTHGLASVTVVSPSSLTLVPHSTQVVTVTIKDANSLSAGGHYAAIIFQTVPGGLHGNQVTLNQNLASLVFVTTSGQGTYSLQLLPQKNQVVWLGLPSNFNLLFKNTGNVQTAPRGYINVSDPFHRQVSAAIINANSGLVLPGTERLMQTATTQTTRPIWPGWYTVHTYYRYESASSFILMTTRIFYVGPLTTLILILVFVFVFFAFKRHNFVFKNRRQKNSK